MYTVKRCIVIIFLTLSTHAVLWAQRMDIKAKVVDLGTQIAIPSLRIKIDTSYYLSDEQGFLNVTASEGDTLYVNDPDYRPFSYILEKSASGYYELHLVRIKKRKFKGKDQKKLRSTLNAIFRKNCQNNFYTKAPFAYSTYNKLTVNTDNEEQNYNLIGYLKKLIPKRFFNFKYNPRHHIFLMESYTHKKYKSHVRQKEIVHKSRVSGISKSTLFSFNSEYQYTSVYDKYLFFNFTKYENPLGTKAFKKYNYIISDTLWVAHEPKLVIKFYPKNTNLFDAVQGAFVWDVNKGYVSEFHVLPVREKGLFSQLSQKYVQDSKSTYFIPQLTITNIRSMALGYKNITINATAKTYVFNFKSDTSFANSDFDENIYEYTENYNLHYDTLNWLDLRKENFSEYDSSTFALYENFGQIKNMEKVIHIGRNLYEGKIPIIKTNLLLNKLLNYNKVESLRLGLGIETNQYFSKKYYANGYVGYGLQDQQLKYGSLLGMRLKAKTKSWIKLGIHNDLAEPGRIEHFFDRQQYSSESFRKYQLQLLDKTRKVHVLGHFSPLTNLNLGADLSYEDIRPCYTYSYDGQARFVFQELSVLSHYAFGRQFIKYADQQIYFRDRYPIVSYQITQALPYFGSPFKYTRLDLKITYNFWLLGKGNHNIQINAGHISGAAPYYKLYNSKGSFSNLYTTIYNSFETMSYNEFCSDRYISIFYNVNFGRLNRVGRFKPSFTLSHNMGWGSLKNKDKHAGLNFSTMDKGYYEAGATLGDILRYNLYGLKIGLGISVYYRYGPYSYADRSRNFVYKLATSFRI